MPTGAPFFREALEGLGAERELAALLAALQRCDDREVIREIVERSLRLAFRDKRSGWENRNSRLLADGAERPRGPNRLPSEATVLRGLVKIAVLAMAWKVFPFLWRRRVRQEKVTNSQRRYRIEYPSIIGSKPVIPMQLTAIQQRTLSVAAGKAEVWMDQSNLWTLFDLPDNAADCLFLMAALR